jgi:hypothetical protein
MHSRHDVRGARVRVELFGELEERILQRGRQSPGANLINTAVSNHLSSAQEHKVRA